MVTSLHDNYLLSSNVALFSLSVEELQQSEPEESLTLLSLHPHSTVRLAQHSIMIFITSYSFICAHAHTHTLHTHTFQDYLSPVIPSGRGGAARTISAPEESMQWSIWSVRPSYPGGMPRPVPPFSQSDPATSTLETLQLHHVRERDKFARPAEYSQLWPEFRI